jgi:hypothetical protein
LFEYRRMLWKRRGYCLSVVGCYGRGEGIVRVSSDVIEEVLLDFWLMLKGCVFDFRFGL